MILARLSNAIRSQNWFAVALEFVIVIAGVAIGFQVTAWNADRQNAARVDQALIRLQAETEQTIMVLRRRIEINASRQTDQSVMVRVAMNGELAPEDRETFERAVAQVMYFSRLLVQQSSYEALEQSGDLALITDRDLMAELNRYRGRLAWIDNQHASFRRGLTTFSDMLSEFTFHEPTDDPTVTRVRVDLERLSSEPRLQSALVQIARMHAIFAQYVIALEAHSVELCERLAAETGRACDLDDGP
jgi:hypothetical protein